LVFKENNRSAAAIVADGDNRRVKVSAARWDKWVGPDCEFLCPLFAHRCTSVVRKIIRIPFLASKL